MPQQFADRAEKIREWLCRTGRAFQIGASRFVRPEHIVTMREGTAEEEYIFELTDGSQVTHGRFDQGSVGDLLFDALHRVQRPNDLRQTRLPNFNRVLSADSMLDASMSTLATDSNNDDFRWIDQTNELVVGSNQDNDLAVTNGLAFGSRSTIDISGDNATVSNLEVAPAESAQELWAIIVDGGGTIDITTAAYDGTSTSTIYAAVGFDGSAGAHLVPYLDEAAGFGFAIDGADELWRWTLDGTTAPISLGSASFSNMNITAIDRNRQEIYVTRGTEFLGEVVDYDGAQIRTLDQDFSLPSTAGKAYDESADHIVAADTDNGRIIGVDRNGDAVVEDYGSTPNTAGHLDTALFPALI